MNTEEPKIVLDGEFEEVLKINGHFYLRSKKDQVCVLPYTISADGLLDKMGVIDVWNEVERKNVQTLLKDYLNEDDGTNLVGANRVLYEISGTNLEDASRWMYLGTLVNTLSSDSPIRVYAADVSGVEVKPEENVMNETMRKKFRMIDSSSVVQSDDLLFLGAFTRLFNYIFRLNK